MVSDHVYRKRIVRAWSAMAREMACRIHQVCIGGEFIALRVVELADGLDEAEIALLDEIEEWQAAADITLCDGNDETKVGLCHFFLGLFIALGHAHGELVLLLQREQGILPILLRYMRTGSFRLIFSGEIPPCR